MGVATAIGIGAGVAGITGLAGSAMASSASNRAAREGIRAQIEATQLQVAEVQRQYDTNMRVLGPLIQTQYGADAGLADLLGLGGRGESFQELLSQPTPADMAAAQQPQNAASSAAAQFAGNFANAFGRPEANEAMAAAARPAPLAPVGAPPPSMRGQAGGFQDPNLNPATFGRDDYAETEIGQQVTGRRLAPTDPNQDIAIQRAQDTALYQGVEQDSLVQQVQGNQLRNDIGQRLLAAGPMAEDERFRFAQDTAVVGPEFESSPGYAFQMEEALRASDRALSRGGGNYGGRAAIEAQRRAQGLAAQDYYNYVGARQADLARQDQAAAAFQGRQAMDASRLDSAASFDISRGDSAVQDARRREEMDLMRGDTALASFLQRATQQIGREDMAVMNNQALQQGDRQRQDQSYYNYLNTLMGLRGGGNVANQAASLGTQMASQSAAAQGAGAAAQGQIAAQNAANQGAIWSNAITGLGNVVNQGVGNYMFDRYLNGRAA